MPTDLLILDITTGLIVGAISDLTMGLEPNHRLLPTPDLFTPDHAADWYWNGDDLIWDALGALEPCEGKLSSTVLRGGREWQ